MQVETAALVLSYACDKFDWIQAKVKGYAAEKISALTESWAEVLGALELLDCTHAIDEFYRNPDHPQAPRGIDQFPARIRKLGAEYARDRALARHGRDRYKCAFCRDTGHVHVMEFRPDYKAMYDGLGASYSVAILCCCAPNEDGRHRIQYRDGIYEIATFWTELRENLWWKREQQPEQYKKCIERLRKQAGPEVKALFAALKERISTQPEPEPSTQAG